MDRLKGYKVKREIISSLPSIDGRLEEMSQSERDLYIKVLYKNTKKLINCGVLVPIKEGHEDKNEGLQGTLTNVRLKRKFRPKSHLVIVGELFLEDQLYQKYQEGRYPSCSVETYRYANITSYTGNDEAIGEHIYGVALLGTTPASFPHLEREDEVGTPYQAHFSRANYGVKHYSIGQNTVDAKDKNTMEMMTKLKEPLQKMMEIINEYEEESSDKSDKEESEEMGKEYMAGEEMGKEKESREGAESSKGMEKDDEDEDKDEVIKNLKEKIARLEEGQIGSEFSRLANEGYLTLENKDHFKRIAKNEGLEFAKEVFGGKTAPQAPKGEMIDPSIASKEDQDRLRESYRRAGLSSGEIEKVLEKQKTQ